MLSVGGGLIGLHVDKLDFCHSFFTHSFVRYGNRSRITKCSILENGKEDHHKFESVGFFAKIFILMDLFTRQHQLTCDFPCSTNKKLLRQTLPNSRQIAKRFTKRWIRGLKICSVEQK